MKPCRAALLFVVCLSLAVVSPASAAPGDGAQVSETRDCTVRPGLSTDCIEIRTVTNRTETASGTSFIQNVHYEVSTVGEPGGLLEGCIHRTTGHEQWHLLVKREDTQQARRFNIYQDDVINCFGSLISCDVRVGITVVRGEFVQDVFEVTCRPL